MKVKMQGGVHYERIDDEGLWIRDGKDAARCLAVDSVILCAGQESERSLVEPLQAQASPSTSSAAPTSPPNSMPSAPSGRAPSWRRRSEFLPQMNTDELG